MSIIGASTTISGTSQEEREHDSFELYPIWGEANTAISPDEKPSRKVPRTPDVERRKSRIMTGLTIGPAKTATNANEMDETNLSRTEDQLEEEPDPEIMVKRLSEQAKLTKGYNSPEFLNAIGKIFLEDTESLFDAIPTEDQSGDITSINQLLHILNDYTRSLAKFSPVSGVFGSIALLAENHLLNDVEVDFARISSICKKHFNSLFSSYESCLREIEGLNYQSTPTVEPSVFFSTYGQDESDED